MGKLGCHSSIINHYSFLLKQILNEQKQNETKKKQMNFQYLKVDRSYGDCGGCSKRDWRLS